MDFKDVNSVEELIEGGAEDDSIRLVHKNLAILEGILKKSADEGMWRSVLDELYNNIKIIQNKSLGISQTPNENENLNDDFGSIL